jgi:hypothetical protein
MDRLVFIVLHSRSVILENSPTIEAIQGTFLPFDICSWFSAQVSGILLVELLLISA